MVRQSVKGHDYLTIASNAQGQVLAVGKTVAPDSLDRFYDSRDGPLKQSIISISMDMSPPYQKATFAHIEKAQRKIAFDHFNVAQTLTRTLDATRRANMVRADRSMRQEIQRSRYTLLVGQVPLSMVQKTVFCWPTWSQTEFSDLG